MNYSLLAGQALSKALLLRKKYNLPLTDSVDAINLAELIGIEVRLTDIPSMEGIYSPGGKSCILLSTYRPQGRRNFTCAHEIGHHIFDHGEQFDEIRADSSRSRAKDPEEYIADCFAGYLLMPKTTIESGISKRNIDLKKPTPAEIFGLASWLNVGYSTLIMHMCYSLNILNNEIGIRLLKEEPKKIRAKMYAKSASSNLHVFDKAWSGRAIDCEVGEFIRVPAGAFIEGDHTSPDDENENFLFLKANKPGISRITCSDNSSYIRVTKSKYVGLSHYRHEEEFV